MYKVHLKQVYKPKDDHAHFVLEYVRLNECPSFQVTAVFMLLERLLYQPKQAPVMRVLVLVPTRELGI